MLKRSMIKIALPVVASALVLSACGSDDKKDDSKGSSSAPGGGGGDKPTYTIGFQAGLSGENSALGLNEKKGAELAVEQANASGALPFTLKFTTSDDEASETKSVAAAQKLIDDKNVVVVVGPAFSGPTQAASPNYAKAKLATLSPSATRVSLTDPKNNFTAFLRGTPNDSAQGGGMAMYFSQKLHLKNVMIVNDKTPYGEGLAAVAKDGLTKAGVQVQSESAPQKTPDYTSLATKVKNSGADGLIYAGYYDDAAPFAKKLKEAGVTIPMISGDGTKDDKFVDNAKDAAENWLLTCPCMDASKEAKTAKFVTDYKAKYKEDPGAYSAESYDLANFAIEQMKTFSDPKSITREALLGKLKAATYTGLTKTFKFDQNGEYVGEDIFLYTVKGGKIEYTGNIKELSKS
ncbi:branched-chain amino acid ABC transporter substrate-binding protein [Yinghuangia seranimata]|uniref:branched-chain amino acid ABC transporter substrate-binding protein n=1 Tax=Yinghuangia seranimata TaxID=408067 RepID=UPI00248AE6BF|nr:branched-chain amino acid ABC transporter substrate-binding protein [Yinghuangia seranimata]MDI2126252.1 branched-chain amino acid ABC transporter substrate-binding protein [Yinghuangia seranimata]